MSASNKVLALILFLLPVSLCLYLNAIDLRFEEPRRALVALEMVFSGDYIVPHINGMPYYNKPPLFNWILAGMFNLSGHYANWIVRIPSLLALMVMAFLNFRFVTKYFNRQTAILSSLFFITSADIFFFGTLIGGEIDLFYALVVFLQVIAIYHFYRQGRYGLLFVFSYFFMSVGVLTKGFPSLLFQGLTLLMLVIWQKDKKLLFRWQHALGLSVFACIVGLYFYRYSLQEDLEGFLTNLFFESASKSGLGEHQNKLLVNAITFPVQLLRFLAPWSVLFFLPFLKNVMARMKGQPFLVFCCLFILVNIPVYWFTGSVKSRYMYMFFPFLCIFAAYGYQVAKEEYPKVIHFLEKLFFFLMIVVSTVFLILPFLSATRDIAGIGIKSAGLFILAGGMVWGYHTLKAQRIFIFILFVIFLRIGMTFFYFPVYNRSQKTENTSRFVAEKVLEFSGKHPVYLTGPLQAYPVQASLGPVVFSKTLLEMPPFIPYGLSYYYSVLSGTILQYQPEPGKGAYCIIQDDYLPALRDNRFGQVSVLYNFSIDGWKEHYSLVYLE